MKWRNCSRTRTVIGLLLGLIVAWTSIAPQTALKDVTGGEGCYCKNLPDITCDAKNYHCNNLIDDCNMKGNSYNTLNCDTPPGADQCDGDLSKWDAECNELKDQTCNDD